MCHEFYCSADKYSAACGPVRSVDGIVCGVGKVSYYYIVWHMSCRSLQHTVVMSCKLLQHTVTYDMLDITTHCVICQVSH